MSLGVATANSVLVVSFARDNLMRGMDPVAAALDAGEKSNPPRVDDCGGDVNWMLPMSLGLGEAERTRRWARAVIGGLSWPHRTPTICPVVFQLMHRRAPAHSKADDSYAQRARDRKANSDLI